jgi:hypothetical protein
MAQAIWNGAVLAESDRRKIATSFFSGDALRGGTAQRV